MAFQTGEKYRCTDAGCGCEIQVTRGAQPGKGGNQNPRCCCGKEMTKLILEVIPLPSLVKS